MTYEFQTFSATPIEESQPPAAAATPRVATALARTTATAG